MDLAEIAAQFDDEKARAAVEELAGACNEADPLTAEQINTKVAKTAREWALVMECAPSTVYNLLRDRCAAGTWDRIGVREKSMQGRASFYYYPAGSDPLLPDS